MLGEVVPLPEGLTSTDGLWALPAGEDIEHVQLLRWRLSLPDGAGQWILLCRLAEALALVSAGALGAGAGGSDARLAAAAEELAAGLGLLAAFCSRDPQTALELLHVELPTSGALEGGQRGPDLLSLACQAAAVLAGLPEPPAAAIADCLAICGALAEGIPGRVANELLSLAGASPALVAATPPGQAPELPLLARVLAAEAAQGRYPATQAFIRLLTTLVSGELGQGRRQAAGCVCQSAVACGPSSRIMHCPTFSPAKPPTHPSSSNPAHCSCLARPRAARAGGLGAAPSAGGAPALAVCVARRALAPRRRRPAPRPPGPAGGAHA